MGKRLALLVSFLGGTALWAATTPATTTSTSATVPAATVAAGPQAGDIFGTLDIRPSISAAGQDTFRTENSVELGVNVTDYTKVSYFQAFVTNLSGNRAADGKKGLDLYMDEGFFRGSFAPLYKSADGSVSLSYAWRLHTPTLAPKREAGFITTWRNYFTVSKKLNSVVTVSGSLVPMLHAYSKAGFNGSANPIFENREYLMIDFQLTSKLSLALNAFFHQTRHRNFQAGAKNNNDWSLFLWTWPELLYAVTPNLSVGVAYYSDNLLKADGWAKGVGQMTLQATL